MKKPISLFLFAAFLAFGMMACSSSPTPTEAPTEAPTEQPTEVPTEAPTATPVEEPTPSLGDIWMRPADGMATVYVPAGEFEMGSDDDEVDYALQLCNDYFGDCEQEWFEDEQPIHTVALDGFWIDQTEVTNGQYRRCVEAGACDPPAESGSSTHDSYYGHSAYDAYLVIYVSWHQAAAYCAWAGARLPTEAEWEYAARGPQGRVFPWGDAFDGTWLNYCDANCEEDWADETVDDGYADTALVGSFLAGASWCDVQDLAGNVWEWVADWHDSDYYDRSPSQNPTGPSSGEYKLLRGGSWNSVPHHVRSANRLGHDPDCTINLVGFRCARGSEKEKSNAVTNRNAASVTPTGISTPTAAESSESVIPPQASVYFGYTYQQPDGNRLMHGQGAVPDVQPLDIPLDDQPQWLVAAPMRGGSVWVAVLVDGRVQAFHVIGKKVKPMTIVPPRLPSNMPPLLRVKDNLPSLITNPSAEASSMTHPVVLPSSGDQLALIEASGDLAIWNENKVARIAVNALVDAHLLLDESARLLLLTDATTRYGHGVLGDAVEATSITLVETVPTPRVARRIVLPPPRVVEGIAPIWTDMTGDGKREIIVTLSDVEQGAQIVIYDEDGEQLATGPAIGRGYRWRHQLVVAPFGPNGDLELADVLTPHIGGVVEFYRLAGNRLEIVAQVPGYTSHVIGSRNLDTAVAGDFDGDGRMELLVPNQARTSLGAIRRKPGGAEVAWTIPVGGRVMTNLAAVVFPDDTLAVGVGHEGNMLRLWLP